MSQLLNKNDPQLLAAIDAELVRQRDHIELIASENYASEAVMAVQGTILTNKYAEGYPGKRYYGGCEYVDVVESLAIDRARQLFKVNYANVQPHSGSQANYAVFQALLSPGDVVLGMSLKDGGHLTHGASVNFSGKIYHSVAYGVDEKGYIDYQEVRTLAKQHQPKLMIAGFSAYSRIVDWQVFRDIADEVGAYLLVDMAHVAGLVAAGVYPSPVDAAHVITTTTHKTLRGPRGGMILGNVDDELAKRLDSAIFPGSQGGPLMHVIGAKATAFLEAATDDFVDYQQQVVANARAMAARFEKNGYQVVSGGTDNHMFLIDFSGTDLTGKQAEVILGQANITLNKNSVPGDQRSPFVTSGIRIGTPAITTRGFKQADVEQVADWMCQLLDNVDQPSHIAEVRQQVVELCQRYPIYAEKAE